MSAKRSRSRSIATYELDFFGELTLSNFLDWLTVLCLGCLLAVTTLQLGSVRAETQLLGIWISAAMLVSHSLWILAQRETITFKKSPFLFLPFLAWLLVSCIFITPTPWIARTEVLLAIQAFLVLWVSTQNARTRNQVWFLYGVLALVSGLGVLMAINQYYHDSSWLPKLLNPLELKTYRISGHAQYAGRASGPFGSPNSFAALMLIAFFPAALAALAKRLTGITRVFCGYLALLFLGGLAMTLSRGAMVAFLPGLLLLPWVLRLPRRQSILFSGGTVVALIVVASSLAIFSTRFSARWDNFVKESGERTRPAMWQGALDIALEHPLIGNGLGSFRYSFDNHRPEGFTPSPDHAHNDYLEILADLGLIGFLLLFAPAAWLWIRAFLAWNAMPDRVSLDEIDTRRRRSKVMPIPKLFLGVNLLTLACLGLHLFVEFHLHVPALLFWIAFCFGILLKYTPGASMELAPRRLPAQITALVCAVFGPSLAVFALSTYKAEMFVFEGRRQADLFASDFNQLRFNAEFLEGRIAILQAAIEENPNHAEAHRQLALALADLSYAAPLKRVPLGAQAEKHARIALESFPQTAAYWSTLGETLFLQERWQEAGEAYLKATELAPNSAEAWYFYANWLNGEHKRHDEALRAIDRCLELDPDNPEARDLRRRILIP